MSNEASVASAYTREQIKELIERVTALGGYL
jgi:hypothetical protein